jgi:hypothetical protein
VEKARGERTCKPDSVPPNLSDGDDHFSGIRVASNLKRPTRRPRPGQPVAAFTNAAVVFLFGLASSDAYRAGNVTIPAVGSYPAVSPLPDPQRLDWDPVALAIGGLFSVVQVSDRSAWVLPSALPSKSGLSSRHVASDHPILSFAQFQYRKEPPRMQGVQRSSASSGSVANWRQFGRWNRRFGLIDRHGFRHPLFQLVDPRLVARMSRHEFSRRTSSRLFHTLP